MAKLVIFQEASKLNLIHCSQKRKQSPRKRFSTTISPEVGQLILVVVYLEDSNPALFTTHSILFNTLSVLTSH